MQKRSCAAAVPFDVLQPLPSGERFSFCHGEGWPSADELPEIEAYCQARRVKLVHWREGRRERWCFVVDAAVALRGEDFAGGLVIDLVNEGYLRPRSGAEERYDFDGR